MDGVVPTEYQQITDNERSTIDAGVPEEAALSIYVNGVELTAFMFTPVQQKALALGFLKNEGLIARIDEVQVAHVCTGGTCADIWLSHAVQRPSRSIITSGCGGGVTFVDLSSRIEPLTSEVQVTPAQVRDLMRQLLGAGKLYNAVRGVHTSVLSDGERVLLVAEDIGRHNTVDKLRGLALMQGLDTRGCILLSSGRISSEMLVKAAKMGMPVIVSHSSPTSLAVTMARAWGITLIGYVRRNRMNVYAGEERLRIEA